MTNNETLPVFSVLSMFSADGGEKANASSLPGNLAHFRTVKIM